MIEPVDFSKDDRWTELFYASPKVDARLIKELAAWLREHRNDFVRLYHGTCKDHPIMEKGLLPTSQSRRNSLQSRSGFVSVVESSTNK